MRPIRRRFLPAFFLGLVALGLTATGCNFKHDPAKMVTIVITGISADADIERVKETVKKWTDGNSHLMTTNHDGGTLSIDLSPVTDVDAFVKKINFGEVTAVDGRKISVTYKKP
jgi:hypothetical protein